MTKLRIFHYQANLAFRDALNLLPRQRSSPCLTMKKAPNRCRATLPIEASGFGG